MRKPVFVSAKTKAQTSRAVTVAAQLISVFGLAIFILYDPSTF